MYCITCGSDMSGTTCPVCGVVVSSDGASELRLAGWWRRVGATFADDLILLLPLLLAYSFFYAIGGALTAYIVSTALQGLYMVKLLAAPNGQTIGNRVAATRVRDALSGAPITSQQALRRWGVVAAYGAVSLASTPATSIVVLLVGLADILYPLFNPRKQTLHDLVAGTIVVLV